MPDGYSVARVAAPRIARHFAEHRAKAPLGETLGELLPDSQTIEALIDAAFWASLRREEGFVPKISFALLSPDRASRPLMFDRPLKTVLRAPFAVTPKPAWFVTHRRAQIVGRRVAPFEASPSMWRLPGIIVPAMRP